MFSACKPVSLVTFLALLTAAPAFTQTPSDEETPEATAAAPVAHVYVQTTKGVDVYDATAAGKLTLVKGSPFSISGQMEGINGKYLIGVGTDYLHTYAIESSGAVGSQASEINTQNYSGSECGATAGNGAFFDHTGAFFYVQLSNEEVCAAWQSYQLASNGTLLFLGSFEDEGTEDNAAFPSSLPTVSSNDLFAYGIYYGYDDFVYKTVGAFSRSESGLLAVNQNYTETDPPANPSSPGGGSWYWILTSAAADPAGHLAVLMETTWFNDFQNYGPNQLASYTINNTTGGIVSTNTWQNMPTLETNNTAISMSTTGKLLAVFGQGLQLFHFNGANPITAYSKVLLPKVAIDQIGWDNSNHLYALSYTSNELYVYTATPTEIKEVSGSPYKVKNAYGIKGLIVVPKP
jgi:hypothetical protein